MAFTYSPIASVTVGSGGASTIDFTNIPQNYTDLKIVISARSNRTSGFEDVVGIKFNGLSTNFSSRELYGELALSTAGSRTDTNGRIGLINGPVGTANTFASIDTYISNYTSLNNKSLSTDYSVENNGTSGWEGFNAALWSNTTAINSISFVPLFGTLFVQYSTATLYGIRATEY